MYRQMKRKAAALLKENGRTYQRLMRFHCGIAAGIWLVLFLSVYLLLQLSPKEGLSNMDTQAFIFTVQVMLIILGLFLTPFWEAGASYVSLDFIRGKRNYFPDLSVGFRCLKPLSVSMLIRGFQYLLVYYISGTLATFVLQLAPFSQIFYEDLTVLLTEPDTPLQGKMVIVAAVYGFVLTGIIVFLASQLFYRYRMTRYIILDNEETGGMKAIAESKAMMKKKKVKMFRLDLSFWWYHLPQFLGLLLPIGAMLIAIFHLAPSAQVENICWLAAGGSLVLRLVVGLLGKPKVAAVYGLFYQELSSPRPEITVDPPKKPPFAC